METCGGGQDFLKLIFKPHKIPFLPAFTFTLSKPITLLSHHVRGGGGCQLRHAKLPAANVLHSWWWQSGGGWHSSTVVHHRL